MGECHCHHCEATEDQMQHEELLAEIATLEAKLEESNRVKDHLLLEAQGWAMEAKTQRNTVNGVGSLLGGVGDWGPIVEGVANMKEKIAEQDQKAEMQMDTIKTAHYWLREYVDDADNATHARRILLGSIVAEEGRVPNPAALEDLTQLVSHAAKHSASSGQDLEVILRDILKAMREPG